MQLLFLNSLFNCYYYSHKYNVQICSLASFGMQYPRTFALTVVVAGFAFISDSRWTVRSISENFSSNRVHTKSKILFTRCARVKFYSGIIRQIASECENSSSHAARNRLTEINATATETESRRRRRRRHDKEWEKYVIFNARAEWWVCGCDWKRSDARLYTRSRWPADVN